MATRTRMIRRRTTAANSAANDSVFFACRIDREVADLFRQRARDNGRTIGSELTRTLRAVLAADQPKPEKGARP